LNDRRRCRNTGDGREDDGRRTPPSHSHPGHPQSSSPSTLEDGKPIGPLYVRPANAVGVASRIGQRAWIGRPAFGPQCARTVVAPPCAFTLYVDTARSAPAVVVADLRVAVGEFTRSAILRAVFARACHVSREGALVVIRTATFSRWVADRIAAGALFPTVFWTVRAAFGPIASVVSAVWAPSTRPALPIAVGRARIDGFSRVAHVVAAVAIAEARRGRLAA
jgi:hypothetical protein